MQITTTTRLKFSSRYAAVHWLVSLLIALLSAAVVFGLWYPTPYRQMLAVGQIYLLVLGVDVVCGPFLTLILASPTKSRRERWVDFSLIGAIQIAALAYGMYSVWLARPVVFAFEVDRFVVATANEVDTESLPKAMPGLQQLPWAGLLRVGTRKAQSTDEAFQSMTLGLAGVSPAMRPDWWQPWSQAEPAIRAKAQPVAALIARRPQDAHVLRQAVQATGRKEEHLTYLPLTTRKVKEWVVLLDSDLHAVGYAPVDGF